MADYKRMVSYMYQYERGIKRRNVGYARIEARNGQCKFTLHMQLLGQLDSIFPTYLIRRDDKNLDLIYLGDSVLKNQVMDSKLLADEKNIMNAGYGLSDIGGILLFLNDEIFFATEWDNRPVVAKEVLEALKPKVVKEKVDLKKTNTQAIKRDTPIETKTAENVLKEYKTEREKVEEINHIKIEDNLSDNLESNNANIEKELPQKLQEADPVQEEPVQEIKPVQEVEPVQEIEPVSSEPSLANIEDKMPKYKLPRGWKTVEGIQLNHHIFIESAKRDILTNLEQLEDMTRLNWRQVAAADITADRSEQTELQYETLETEDCNTEESESSDTVEIKSCNAMDTETIENPVAARMFEKYPRMYPFEDNEVTMCVKIEPKDIGFLPTNLWSLSNNSFLLHGYYSHRHLIFAQINARNGCRYILGVPGIFQSKERNMARMFGFENFKSIRKKELRQGDFGYWCIPINM